MYKIIQKRKTWLSFSGTLVVLSIVALAVWGLDFGIDFTGGSLLEVNFFGNRPTVTEVQDDLKDLDLGMTVQPVGEKGMIFRFQDINEDLHQKILEKLDNISKGDDITLEISNDNFQVDSEGDGLVVEQIDINADEESNVKELAPTVSKAELTNIEEMRFDSVGPSIGQELKQKSVYAIFFVLIAIVLYIAWVFRKVSKPVASWKYGIAAIIALFHDVIITMGVFAILGKYFGIEINTPFVAAILTVLGYSVNDTIIVFDRIRENLPKSEEDFENTVNASVNQTIQRSINTSLTTLLVLLSILFFGGDTIKDFVLALSIGIFVGTYSSIFIASPVLVVWEKIKSRAS